MCHGTSIHPASVKAAFEPGKSQKADGLTEVLAGASMRTFVSDLGLAPLTRYNPTAGVEGANFDCVGLYLKMWYLLKTTWRSYGQHWIRRYYTPRVA